MILALVIPHRSGDASQRSGRTAICATLVGIPLERSATIEVINDLGAVTSS
jgi:hypothetical protein